MKNNYLPFVFIVMCLSVFSGCKKKNIAPEENKKPKAGFSFTDRHPGVLPDTLDFLSTATNAKTYSWYFGDGQTSSEVNPQFVCNEMGKYKVKLVVKNEFGSDSISKDITVSLDKPVADFTFSLSGQATLPVTLSCQNQSVGSGLTYQWSFGNGASSSQKDPAPAFRAGGIYQVKLVAANAAGKDSVTKEIRISPYPQAYTNFDGQLLQLFAWEGNKVVILSASRELDRVSMYKWLHAADNTYDFYKKCTGREPAPNTPTFINQRSTIADVTQTCGAGCGYLGATGIELLHAQFEIMYKAIHERNEFDQPMFYEFGRNFWFYKDQLEYKANDPIVTGYAVFMRFMAMEAAGVQPAPFNGTAFTVFKNNVIGLIDTYLANNQLNWGNTLGAGQGIPGSGLGATDLFASFCFRLRKDYGGDAFVEQLWKEVAKRPAAGSTQDAVDNFFLAACATAHKDLSSLFSTWKWPLSASAKSSASTYQ